MMKRHFVFSMCTLLMSTLLHSHPFHFNFNKLTSYFSKKPPLSKTFYKEFVTTENNPNLNIACQEPCDIEIKTAWHLNKITATARVECNNQELLENITVTDKQEANNFTLSIAKNETIKQSAKITISIIVPKHASVRSSIGNGNIVINNSSGVIHTTAKAGSIIINNPAGDVCATLLEKGNIHVEKPCGKVNASTNRGTVCIADAKNSVYARTTAGNLTISCKEMPAACRHHYETVKGNIFVSLPAATNAEIQARTTQGILTCAHPLTVKPFKTTLDKDAWKRFRQQIDALMGSGDAHLSASAMRGNITITEYVTV